MIDRGSTPTILHQQELFQSISNLIKSREASINSFYSMSNFPDSREIFEKEESQSSFDLYKVVNLILDQREFLATLYTQVKDQFSANYMTKMNKQLHLENKSLKEQLELFQTQESTNSSELLSIQTKELEILRMKENALNNEINKIKEQCTQLKKQIASKDEEMSQVEQMYSEQIQLLSENLQQMQIQASNNLQLGKNASQSIQNEMEQKYNDTIIRLTNKVKELQGAQDLINQKMKKQVQDLEDDNQKLHGIISDLKLSHQQKNQKEEANIKDIKNLNNHINDLRVQITYKDSQIEMLKLKSVQGDEAKFNPKEVTQELNQASIYSPLKSKTQPIEINNFQQSQAIQQLSQQLNLDQIIQRNSNQELKISDSKSSSLSLQMTPLQIKSESVKFQFTNTQTPSQGLKSQLLNNNNVINTQVKAARPKFHLDLSRIKLDTFKKMNPDQADNLLRLNENFKPSNYLGEKIPMSYLNEKEIDSAVRNANGGSFLNDYDYKREVSKIKEARKDKRPSSTNDFSIILKGYQDENEKYEKRIRELQTRLRKDSSLNRYNGGSFIDEDPHNKSFADNRRELLLNQSQMAYPYQKQSNGKPNSGLNSTQYSKERQKVQEKVKPQPPSNNKTQLKLLKTDDQAYQKYRHMRNKSIA